MRRALLAAGLLGAGIVIYGAAQALALSRARAVARARLLAHPVRRMALSHSEVAYVDCGPRPSGGGPGPGPGSGCETILSVHGLYGGYDQALENVGSLSEYCRVLAPSRFGYPGSAVRGDGSPAAQA
ncbi:MAG: alpha/beta hydrolase, partial [Actinomyces sp.]